MAFKELKKALTTAPLLIHPNYNEPFILQCDASQDGVGCVLIQLDSEGIEKPVAYMSKKLNRAQRNYSTSEQECLAAVLGVNKFRAYIEGHPFKILTDHASLKWLMQQKDLTGRLARWSLKLQGFDFMIEHRRGNLNVVPDALSRMYNPVDTLDLTTQIIDLESDHFDSVDYRKLIDHYTSNKAILLDLKLVGKFLYKRNRG